MTRRDVAALLALLVAVTGVLYLVRVPAPTPRGREHVVIDVRVRADGTTRVLVVPGSGERDDIREAAREIAESIAGRVARRVEMRSRDGSPYAEVFLGRMFEPAEAPRVSFDATAAYLVAYGRGWQPDFRLSLPDSHTLTLGWRVPPDERTEAATWRWGATVPASGEVVLRPAPGLGWLAAALLVAGVVAAFLGISLWPRRRARGRLVCGAVALATAVVVPFLRAWPDDELGASGAIGGAALTLAGYAGLAWLLTMPLGLWLLLTPRRRATMRA